MESPEYEPGKIFVGGLSWETNEEGMRKHFEQFGAVADCVVMRDAMQPPGIKKNRGFGFVKFEDPSTVDKVVQHPIHTLDNKTIDPKRAQKKSGGKDTDKKVFLGGLASTTTEQDVENYFNTHYGGVTEVVFKVDKTTNRKRGFGFVVFEAAEYVERVLQLQYHEIDGKKVETKRTEPRSATASAMRHTNPALGAYAAYQQPYGHGDYRGASNGQQYPGQYYGGGGGQPYYNPYGGPPQAGYGQQYSSATNYSYDHTSQYPRTQTSTGDRQDTQSYYHQQPYGHGGAQPLAGGYGQDASSYTGRSAYGGPQDSYGPPGGGYPRGGGQQQQPRYGGYGH